MQNTVKIEVTSNTWVKAISLNYITNLNKEDITTLISSALLYAFISATTDDNILIKSSICVENE